mmetsp:Transcript_15804/g.61765  ORF Transcript_15804/g.61765 Transcript_15804/m.61765 type:complete len:333 (-) Transcript_15804:19-1017(-)
MPAAGVDAEVTAVAAKGVVKSGSRTRPAMDLSWRKQILVSGFSGTAAGGLTALLFCPFDVVRTNMAVHHIGNASGFGGRAAGGGILSTTRHVYARQGFLGFYTGLGTTFVALAPNWGVYFATYKFTKEKCHEYMDSSFEESAVVHVISAAFAAAVTDIAVNPAWLIKTRLQTQTYRSAPQQYTGIWNAFQTIVRTEGVLSLWRGLSAQLLGIGHVIIQFPMYEQLRKRFKGAKEEVSVTDTLMASSFSKVVASTCAYPHEVLRMRLYFQKDSDHQPYSGLRDAVKRILKEEGMAGLYRGLSANLLRVIPATAVTFVAYEELSKRFNKYLRKI